MGCEPKSKEKLIAKARANKLRAKLISEGKMPYKWANSELNEVQLSLLDKGNLDGKKVNINMTDYNMRIKKGELSSKFIEWLSANKNNEFVAKKYNNDKTLVKYELEGVENWIFTIFDLDPI